ncbi:HEPN domain-containing protein [candidate division WOR-3 bacterium]|nr:HEPN domain-containing protein [candidate division WOR-3 bacterium]
MMFYAVLALLQTIGKGASKPAGVISLFDKEFVRAGVFPTGMSRSLHKAFGERHESDYETVKPRTQEEASELLAEAEHFVQRVAEYIKLPAGQIPGAQ